MFKELIGNLVYIDSGVLVYCYVISALFLSSLLLYILESNMMSPLPLSMLLALLHQGDNASILYQFISDVKRPKYLPKFQ